MDRDFALCRGITYKLEKNKKEFFKPYKPKLGNIYNMKKFCEALETYFYPSCYIGIGKKIYFDSYKENLENCNIILKWVNNNNYEVIEIQ